MTYIACPRETREIFQKISRSATLAEPDSIGRADRREGGHQKAKKGVICLLALRLRSGGF